MLRLKDDTLVNLVNQPLTQARDQSSIQTPLANKYCRSGRQGMDAPFRPHPGLNGQPRRAKL